MPGAPRPYLVSYKNLDQYGNIISEETTTTVYARSKDEARRTLTQRAGYKIVVTKVRAGGI